MHKGVWFRPALLDGLYERKFDIYCISDVLTRFGVVEIMVCPSKQLQIPVDHLGRYKLQGKVMQRAL